MIRPFDGREVSFHMPDLEFDGTITLSTPVSDLDASITWFADTLGFAEMFKAPEAGWAEVGSSVAGVSIGLSVGDTAAGGGGTTPVFGVVDIDAARSALEGKGVRFEGDTAVLPGMVKLATFFDPDGNRFMLAQSLAGAGD